MSNRTGCYEICSRLFWYKILKEEKQKDIQQKFLSYAVPGDILVTDSHVVIIQDLQYEGNNTVITDYSQVYVIHSASGEKEAWKTWKVHKSKWNEIESEESIMKTYQLRRLKITEGKK